MAKRIKKKSRRRRNKGATSDAAATLPATERGQLHFTIGSLPRRGGGSAGFFNFAHELDLLKAGLLYADQVKVCSVGASFMAGLDDLSNASLEDKLSIIRTYLPLIEPGATPEQLENTYELMEAVKGGRRASRSSKFGPREMFEARRFLDVGWQGIEAFVQEQFQSVGAEGFRTALRSGLVELHPFEHISAEKIVDMGMRSELAMPPDWIDADETYKEYTERIFATLGNGNTYPLFDDLTSDIVAEAIRNRLILPSQGAVARGRHSGLSGDLLQHLPLFERATIPEILDIRKALAEHVAAFREAVAEFAEVIGPASWDEEFGEEAERVFRERVVPAVHRIERAVEESQDLRELSFRFGPPVAVGGASSLGAFVGSGSVLASVAVLAAGVAAGAYQGAAFHRESRRALEGNQLYFYHRAGTLLEDSQSR